MNMEKINNEIKSTIGVLGCEFVTKELSDGEVAVALLDVVDDWGDHLKDAFESASELENELGARDTDCDEEVRILNEMGLEDDLSGGWELTWRVVILER